MDHSSLSLLFEAIPSLLKTHYGNFPPKRFPCINVNKEHSSVGPSAAHYKEIPSGAGEPMVQDRCNYSDNIREPALLAVLSPWLENARLWPGNAATLHCPSLPLPSFFVFAHDCLLSPF